MNRIVRKKFHGITANMSLLETAAAAAACAENYPGQEPSENAKPIIERMEECINAESGKLLFYHGGSAELGVGDTLLPGAVAGSAPVRFEGEVRTHLHEAVFVTTFRKNAELYASFVNGSLFLVSPNSELSVGPTEKRGVSFLLSSSAWRRFAEGKSELEQALKIASMIEGLTCKSATILEVLK